MLMSIYDLINTLKNKYNMTDADIKTLMDAISDYVDNIEYERQQAEAEYNT